MSFLAGGIVSGVGSLLGGIFGASAASKAAQQQLDAQKEAEAQLQGSESQALGYQTNATNQALGNLQPYLSAGSQAEGNLAQLTGTPGQGLLTPWTQTFTAPTAAQAEQTPGYQFQLQQGQKALQNSAAANGGLLSGNTLADLNSFGQGLASSNYQNTFNNALTQYQSAYQSFLNNQSNTYNMLSGQANTGLSAAGTAGNLAQMGANNYGAITTNTGADIAGLLGQQGATQAGGTLGVANALSQGLGNAANTVGQGLTLASLNGQTPQPAYSTAGLMPSYSLPNSSLNSFNPSFTPASLNLPAPQ